jgi:hypothetical protein
MNGHTPGPWQTDGQFVTVGKQFVAETSGKVGFHEDRANALLIAAAPELLAACLSALRALGDNTSPGPMDDDAKTALRAVIAKAGGAL